MLSNQSASGASPLHVAPEWRPRELSDPLTDAEPGRNATDQRPLCTKKHGWHPVHVHKINSPSFQQLVFAGIYAGLGLGTAAAQPLLGALEKALPDGWFENWSKTWSALGIVFMLAGVAHFTAQGAFMSIYPPAGTWGMWALPGSVMTVNPPPFQEPPIVSSCGHKTTRSRVTLVLHFAQDSESMTPPRRLCLCLFVCCTKPSVKLSVIVLLTTFVGFVLVPSFLIVWCLPAGGVPRRLDRSR